MRRFELNLFGLAAGLAATGVLGGCALEPGVPWGVVSPSLALRLELGAGRVDESGHIRTSDDYRIALDGLAVGVESLAFIAGETAALNFDPANPPPGYTLCHSGHCHATDGRLVDYADIAAELASGGAAAGPLITIGGGSGEVAVATTTDAVALGPCPDDCAVYTPVELALARAGVASVAVSGRVFDTRTGDARRLPDEGLAFAFDWEPASGEVVFATTIGARFGPGKDAGLAVALGLSVNAALFDGLPWDDDEAFAEAIKESFAGASRLVIDTSSRFSP